jgi:septum formation protein
VGLKFEILPAHIDETYLAGETPHRHVRRLSGDKAKAIASQHPEALVLGADTIVVIDGLILGKPENKKKARQMLKRLSNRTHMVFTGFTLARTDHGISRTRVIRSAVTFTEISPEEMDWYVDSDEPYDKAGGYAVQGKGASFIKAIRGSYTNVIGLPLCEVLEELKILNAIHFR